MQNAIYARHFCNKTLNPLQGGEICIHMEYHMKHNPEENIWTSFMCFLKHECSNAVCCSQLAPNSEAFHRKLPVDLNLMAQNATGHSRIKHLAIKSYFSYSFIWFLIIMKYWEVTRLVNRRRDTEDGSERCHEPFTVALATSDHFKGSLIVPWGSLIVIFLPSFAFGGTNHIFYIYTEEERTGEKAQWAKTLCILQRTYSVLSTPKGWLIRLTTVSNSSVRILNTPFWLL